MIARVLLALMVLPVFVVGRAAALDQLEGRRFCLGEALAATSASFTDSLCTTFGSGTVGQGFGQLGGLHVPQS